MERITDRGIEIPALRSENEVFWLKLYEKLTKYEDLEEEGRLLVLPCKVGETIYYLNPFDEIEKGRITMIQQKANGTLKFRVTTTFSHDVTSDAIGETVFLTREAAETKLEEMDK